MDGVLGIWGSGLVYPCKEEHDSKAVRKPHRSTPNSYHQVPNLSAPNPGLYCKPPKLPKSLRTLIKPNKTVG